jgi:hypothetical protein
VLLLLLPLAGVAILVARAGREPVRAQENLASLAAAEVLPGAVDALGYARRLPSEGLTPAPSGAVPARAFLADYYGAAWQEKEARLLAAGVDLDVPYLFHPWEEAEPVIRESYRLSDEERTGITERRFGWPTELSLDWVRQTFATGRQYPLSEEDLPVLQDLVADLNLELLGKLELWTASIDVLLQERFRRGEFVRMPYTNQGLDDSQGFYAKGVGGLGWATGITLRREDYPDMVLLEQEIDGLRRQRYERVVRFLHGRIER